MWPIHIYVIMSKLYQKVFSMRLIMKKRVRSDWKVENYENSNLLEQALTKQYTKSISTYGVYHCLSINAS